MGMQNSSLHQTDSEDLLSILPSNVWAYTFQKLENKHSSSLENLSNSSLYFRSLILSKRVLFLFPQVVQLIGPEFASQNNTKQQGSNITKCRKVAKAWTKAVDQFIISSTLEPDFFDTEPPQPSDHALVNARYQYFGYKAPTKLPQFLAHFEQTHLPQSLGNPFIGNVVHIDLTGFIDHRQWGEIADQVLTLFRKYGHHIRILNFGSFAYYPDRRIQLQNHLWLLECLELCPNLTHLKVFQRVNPDGEIDVAFGESPPDPRRRTEPGQLIRGFNFQGLVYRLELLRDPGNAEEVVGVHPPAEGRRHLEPNQNLGHRANPHAGAQLPPFIHFYRHAIPAVRLDPEAYLINEADLPRSIPTLKNLKCLKLSYLSFLNFNALISANTHVVWLQVEPLSLHKQRYIDYHALEFPNLKKLHIKLCSPADVRKLENLPKSWLSLTHLHFHYCTSEMCCLSVEFIEWGEIFGVISKNWGTTLTELKLRLPIARTQEDRRTIMRDSGEERLYLLTLKKLKVWLSERPGSDGNGRVAKLDFLDFVREGLEQLTVE